MCMDGSVLLCLCNLSVVEGHFGAEDAGHQFVISDELNLTVAGVNQKDP